MFLFLFDSIHLSEFGRIRVTLYAQRAIAPALAAGLVADAIGFAEILDTDGEVCHGVAPITTRSGTRPNPASAQMTLRQANATGDAPVHLSHSAVVSPR